MDMFSTENSSFSPRISFSHNLDDLLIESYPSPSNPNPNSNPNPKSDFDFDFCFTADPIQNETSSADELFSNGLIRRPNCDEENQLLVPNSSSTDHEIFREGQIREEYLEQKRINSSSTPSMEISKEIVLIESKSFWRIKRSSSLHFESTKQKTSSFWSSLPLLSRSNSTGSVEKDGQSKQSHQLQKKQSKNSSMAVYSSSMKPPLKRNHGGTYDYGTRITPVLNVPPPFVSKGAANLLGLGSFFGHGSDDQKNKKQSW
ncbi:uncharacterized protein LOC112524927 [Cynara cardunculus var. scolymus]|uniref:Uncharacterized protein n=1 Tax=Cynara cardunculus var. scolymus TaxID=59895 RepID=A0A124SFW1_CYNCS|nr:uncharacterized protein LOC112524927 [Cynara cardunculus var. scolymus]KVI04471.1 hypothetical protein Ccrd_017216 [Cynara cardunculus var. scolymus]